MQWYWVVLIVVVSQAVLLLLMWLALKKTVGQIPFKELNDVDRRKYQDQIEAEMLARGKAEKSLRELAAEQKKILDWWKKAEGKVNREVQDEFKSLVSDPSALDRKLDNLLSGSSEDATEEANTPNTEEGG
jgi:hypothetical protein